jgi:hypothetical protein
MKIYFLILALLLGFKVVIFGQSYKDSILTKTINVNSIKDLDNLAFDFCDTFSIEITGLYPILKTMPSLQDDSTIVKTLLIENGFTQIDWQTGNWEKGPRFTYLKYVKGNCNCRTYKKYYFNMKQPDEYYDLRVSERIICNSDKFMDF